MNRKTPTFPSIILVIFIFISGCIPGTKESIEPTIVATTSIIADVVSHLTGGDIQVTSLMGPGVDPHLYKASQGDVQLLQSANMVVYNGLHLEGKMSEILSKMARSKTVVAVSDGLDHSEIRTINEEADVHDPHIWFDVKLWQKGVAHVSEQIQLKFPEFKDKVAANTAVYMAEMDSVLEVCNAIVATLPVEKRILITSHDAFEYFGRSNNFEVRGLQGISTLSESGLKDVTDMVNFIINRKVKAVFVENSVPQKALRSVIDGCEAKGHNIVIGGELFSDALGAARTPEGTYLGMIEFNITTIVNSLR